MTNLAAYQFLFRCLQPEFDEHVPPSLTRAKAFVMWASSFDVKQVKPVRLNNLLLTDTDIIMGKTNPNYTARKRRHARVRKRIGGTSEQPRLNVFRSLSNIYAQVIDDTQGATLASASSLELDTSGQSKVEQAAAVGKLVAERSLDAGVSQVVFDRGGYKYHGRIKALAEASREAGLKF